MKALSLAVATLIAAGCSTVQETQTKFRCQATVQRVCPEAPNDGVERAQDPRLYHVAFRIDRVDMTGCVVEEIAAPSATVVEGQPCTLVVGDVDPLAAAIGSVSDGCEAVILVPSESISKEALLQFRFKKDNLTVWAQDARVPVSG